MHPTAMHATHRRLQCVRENSLSPNQVEWMAGNPAPEGRPSLAQRFSAGKSGKKDSSPGGTAEFSRTLFGAGFSQAGRPRHTAPIYCGMALATEENTLFAFPPIHRTGPMTITT